MRSNGLEMTGRLVLRRFKSISEAELKLKRVNIVLGPLELGKSNLLERAIFI